MRYGFLIPNYNHHQGLEALIQKLERYGLPCVFVDDGSNQATKTVLETMSRQYDWVNLLTLPRNLGKGGAVQAGLKYAYELGWSHALQIDADGQHDVRDIPKFLEISQKNPEALVSGEPVYDASIPKGRLYGRKITDFWVIIEVWSKTLKDVMCGFRVYPLAPSVALLNRKQLGLKMDFDPEVMVRLYWEGIPFCFIPTKVIYPEGGTSHFHMLKDNLLISWMHTKLFFGMLIRLPKLMRLRNQAQKYFFSNDSEGAASSSDVTGGYHKSSDNKAQHWSTINERGSLWVMRITLGCYRLLGRRFIRYLLYPIVGYFYLTNQKTRMASKQYLGKLADVLEQDSLRKKSFQHFMTFAESALDKFAVWNNEIIFEDVIFPNHQAFEKAVQSKKGGVILSAHLGNIEIARSLSRFESDLVIHALAFNQHAVKFNQLLRELNPDCKLNIIEIQQVDMTLAIQLKEYVDRGEFVVIMGDRTSVTRPERGLAVNFLGRKAYFPEGAFMLAHILKVPAYLMLCMKRSDQKFEVIFDLFTEQVKIDRKDRQASLIRYAQQYAARLEDVCKRYPLQWFNFFDVWQKP